MSTYDAKIQITGLRAGAPTIISVSRISINLYFEWNNSGGYESDSTSMGSQYVSIPASSTSWITDDDYSENWCKDESGGDVKMYYEFSCQLNSSGTLTIDANADTDWYYDGEYFIGEWRTESFTVYSLKVEQFY